jgi:hypothetical protein
MNLIQHFLINLALMGLPIWLVLRLRRLGFVFGVAWFWMFPIAVGEIQRAHDSTAEYFGIGVWFVSGWVFGLIYCLLIVGAKKLVAFALNRHRTNEIRKT